MLTDGLQFLEGSVNTNFVFPTVTRVQKNALLQPDIGEVVFQIDVDPGLYVYDGSTWIKGLSTVNTIINPLTMPAFTGGDVTSTEGTVQLNLTDTGVAAGTYNSVTVNAKGRVTAATSYDTLPITIIAVDGTTRTYNMPVISAT